MPAHGEDVSSNDPKLIRTIENGIVYHKLPDCGFERGIAIAAYQFRAIDARKRNLLEFTDICFDRDRGTLTGSEPEDRLELVRASDVDEDTAQALDYYEVIIPGTQAFERWGATIGGYRYFGIEQRLGIVGFNFSKTAQGHNDWKLPATQHDADVHLYGYLLEKRPDPLPVNAGFAIYINGTDLLDHLRDYELNDGESPIVSWDGAMKFKNASATAVLSTPKSYETFSNSAGEVTLEIAADGTISGSGVLSAKNTRLAGMNPNDWKSVRWEIEKIVGHVAGETGQQFYALGIAKGERVDQDGLVSPVYAHFQINGYGQHLLEAWHDEASLERLERVAQ